MDLASFRSAYPEMVNVGDPTLQVYLDRATARLDPAVWGTRLDEGIGLLAAHLVALSPAGLTARLTSDKGQTTYGKQFTDLERVVSIALRST